MFRQASSVSRVLVLPRHAMIRVLSCSWSASRLSTLSCTVTKVWQRLRAWVALVVMTVSAVAETRTTVALEVLAVSEATTTVPVAVVAVVLAVAATVTVMTMAALALPMVMELWLEGCLPDNRCA